MPIFHLIIHPGYLAAYMKYLRFRKIHSSKMFQAGYAFMAWNCFPANIFGTLKGLNPYFWSPESQLTGVLKGDRPDHACWGDCVYRQYHP